MGSNTDIKKRLQVHKQVVEESCAHFLGFPAALDYDYAELAPFMPLFLNNIGDPYVDPAFTAHTKSFEREVVAFFAELFRAPKDDYWGYVTNGSTECILYALYVARAKYPKAVVYYSSAAHYGVPKNIHVLGMVGQEVEVQQNGEMDYADLRVKLRPGQPAIVVATIGTTMTEAKDNVATITKMLHEAGVTEHFIHVDAALAGAYTALTTPRHAFDFEDGADSLNISGHKFIGSPMPSGVVIVRQQDRARLHAAGNYTGSVDSTISGSRNGHTPLLLWYAIQTLGHDGLKRRAELGRELATYALAELKNIGQEAWRNPGALTVMFKTPPKVVAQKWQLATADGWSHIICMPGITKAQVDEFVRDVRLASGQP